MAVRASIVASIVLLTASAALAGPVSGKLTVPAPGKRPQTGKAYLPRIENPLVPVKPVDPMPHVVIVLQKDGLALPPSQQYPLELRGESFDRPLLPVVAGSEVVIKNLKQSRKSPTPLVEGQPDLLPDTPLNPGATRTFQVGSDVDKLLVLRDKKAKHLRASVLVLSTPYFATPDADGNYKIAGVEKGTYKVRVWYRDGWVEGADTTVEVGDKDGVTKNLDLKSLTTAAAAAGAE